VADWAGYGFIENLKMSVFFEEGVNYVCVE